MKKEDWSIEITPKVSLFRLNLKELVEYRDLILLLVKRDFVTTYRQTALGPLWHLIQPILTSAIFIIVFLRIAKMNINTDVAPVVYYMSAIVIWNFFAGILNKSAALFVNNASVFGKVYFPRLAAPISYVISAMLGFAFQIFFLALVALGVYFVGNSPVHISPLILLTPLILLVLGLQGVSMGMIISSVTVKYRDAIYLLTFGIQLLMYLSPVIYTIQQINDPLLRTLMMFNPMAPFIEMFRYSITGVGEVNPTFIFSSIGITLVLMVIAIITFNKTEKNFIDTI
jgi:lipopolysaccharide transport system permease protein